MNGLLQSDYLRAIDGAMAAFVVHCAAEMLATLLLLGSARKGQGNVKEPFRIRYKFRKRAPKGMLFPNLQLLSVQLSQL